MAKKKSKLSQTDFLDLLFPKKQNERRVLPPNQRAGFRADYNKAMITLYVIGVLFNSKSWQENMPEEVKLMRDQAHKTQVRYERYMPKASQKIVHYGREVVDAYTSDNHEYLRILENQAVCSKYPDKRRMCSFSKRTVDRMVDIIQMYKEII